MNIRLKKTVGIVLALLVVLGSLSACGKESEAEGDGGGVGNKDLGMTTEELSTTDINVDISMEDLDKDKEYKEKVISDDTKYATYIMDGFQYMFTNKTEQWGNLSSLMLNVKIFEEKVEGPRGIKVGDTFNEVMSKLPQEKSWEEDSNGIFYGGNVEDLMAYKQGRVETEDGIIKYIALNVNGSAPFVNIYFENNIVKEIVITIRPIE